MPRKLCYRHNPQIGLLCCVFFLIFSDLLKLICGNCRYDDLKVLMFLFFYDFGNYYFPGISFVVVIYTTGISPPGKTHVPIILDMQKCQNYRKPPKIIENHRKEMVLALNKFSNPICRLHPLRFC